MRAVGLDEAAGRERVVRLLTEVGERWWAPLALTAAYVAASATGVPISPFILAGGAVFGPWVGWAINLAGASLGAVVTFLLGRWLGRDIVGRFLGEERTARLERGLERHGFWTLFRIRFLPIPFSIVNYGSALSGYHLGRFALSTVLGLAAPLLVYTYLGHVVVSAASEDRAGLARNALFAVLGLFAITLAPPLWRAVARRRQRSSEHDPGDDSGDEPAEGAGAAERECAEAEARGQHAD